MPCSTPYSNRIWALAFATGIGRSEKCFPVVLLTTIALPLNLCAPDPNSKWYGILSYSYTRKLLPGNGWVIRWGRSGSWRTYCTERIESIVRGINNLWRIDRRRRCICYDSWIVRTKGPRYCYKERVRVTHYIIYQGNNMATSLRSIHTPSVFFDRRDATCTMSSPRLNTSALLWYTTDGGGSQDELGAV